MTKGEGNQTLGDYVRPRRSSMGLSLSGAAEASRPRSLLLERTGERSLQQPGTAAPEHHRRCARRRRRGPLWPGWLRHPGAPAESPAVPAGKYDLPPEAIADLERYFELLRNYYGIPKDRPVFPPKPRAKETDTPKEVASTAASSLASAISCHYGR